MNAGLHRQAPGGRRLGRLARPSVPALTCRCPNHLEAQCEYQMTEEDLLCDLCRFAQSFGIRCRVRVTRPW